jgi:uncharacterized protein with FMN-binding domain
VRNGTKAFVSIVSLGVVAAGYQVGLAAEISNGFSGTAPVIDQGAASPATTSPSIPTPGETEAGQSTATPAASEVVPSVPTKTSAPAPVSTPKATSPAPAQEPPTNTSGTTKNGDAVPYQFGTVQVSVTKSGGKISAVNMLQSGATGGRQAAFTYLVDLAIQANGTSFGNLSGATYTVDAFKQSLESALAKF